MRVEKISKQVLAAGSLWWPPGQVAAAVDTEGVARKGGKGPSLIKKDVALPTSNLRRNFRG